MAAYRASASKHVGSQRAAPGSHVAVIKRTSLRGPAAGRADLQHFGRQRRADVSHLCAAGSDPPAPEAQASLQGRVGNFIDAQFLPIGLVAAIVSGYCLPELGHAAAKADIAATATTCIFTLSGLQMRKGLAKEALEFRGMYILGLISILCFTPLVARVVLAAPIVPAEFAIGLAVFCCMPTSLSANIALAAEVGANTAMSLLLTATSNIISVFTIPFVTAQLLSMGSAITFDPVGMMLRLVRAVLVPLAVGALLRSITQVREVVDGSKKLIRKLSTVCLAMVPFSQMGTAKVNGILATLTPQMLITMAASVLSALVAIRAVNLLVFPRVAAATGVPNSISRAAILAANQKTLPTSIAVLLQLSAVMGPSAGLATLPCMLAHFSQVLLDSFIIQHWKRKDAEPYKRVAAA